MKLEQVIAELEKDIMNTVKKSERAKHIYDWVSSNIDYDDLRRDNLLQGINLDVQTPEETLLRGKGICCDQAVLYAALGRRLRLNVDYACIETGSDLNHAINIVETEKGPIQVDTTNKVFGAKYQNYKIRKMSVLQNKQPIPSPLAAQRYHQGCSWLKSALIASGIGALVALGVYLIPPMLKQRNVKYLETSTSVRFITKNGDLKFTLEPEARKLVKEALFYTEALQGNSADKDLLAPYVTADLDGNNHFTKEEAMEARDRARADYLRSID